jgi:hypothetical protein
MAKSYLAEPSAESSRYRVMTQRTWTEVVDDPAARHLVVARLEPKAADEPAALLAALIDGLQPFGHYALLTRCEEEGAIILCAFTHPEDAHTLADAVAAMACEDFPEWASRHHFTLCRTTAQAIVDAIEATAAEPIPEQPAVAYLRAA